MRPLYLLIAKGLLTMFLFFFFANSSQAQIGVFFSSPTSGQAVDSNFTITVSVPSTYEVSSVVATVQGHNAALAFQSGNVYSGTLSLEGLPVDSLYTLSVTATDVNNNSYSASEAIRYDPSPVVTLLSPYEDAVARPNLHVKAKCAASGGHCQLAIYIVQGTTSHLAGTFTDSCNTMVDVSAYEGSGNMYLQVYGTDQYNVQAQYAETDFFVETSPYLTPIYSANNFISGFLGNRVLILDRLSFVDSPRIANVTTGAVTSIPFRGQVQYSNGAHITTPGAVFIGQWANQSGVPSGPYTLYSWNNGQLDSVASAAQIVNSLKANGNYCIWDGGGLYYSNLATQTTQKIPMGTSGSVNDITASGVAAYASSGGGRYDSIQLYQNGMSTIIQTNSTGYPLVNPLTDGTNVAYSQQDLSGNESTYRYDAKTATNSLLGSLGNMGQVPLAQPLYLLNNGYTAYLQPDASSHFQVWLRDTAGNTSQTSFFSLSSTLETLASNGQHAYFNTSVNQDGLRYIYDPKTASSLGISSELGTSYYQDSSWYITIGNTLFGVNLKIAADKADSFAITTKEDSVYAFKAADFDTHYHTSGSLMTVTFSKLPVHGHLTINGSGVPLNQAIPRTQLSTMIYTPVANFVGSDTAVWSGSNGFTAGSASALMVMDVDSVTPTVPPAPLISGLGASYCRNSGNTIPFDVTNMPIAGTGTTVVAKMDGQPLAISPGGAMSFIPEFLAAGSHTITVIFSNSLGADTSNAVFQIVLPSTPTVNLTANPRTLTSSTQQVVLIASNVSGGGSLPLYMFAKDAGFSSVVQAESTADSVILAVSTLASGQNTFYVRMRTSDSCSTSSIAVDSIVLTKAGDTATSTSTPNDSSSGPVHIGPNPFSGNLTIRDLDPTVTYGIILANSNGQVVLKEVIQGQQQAVLLTGTLQRDIYFLRLLNVQTGKTVVAKILFNIQ